MVIVDSNLIKVREGVQTLHSASFKRVDKNCIDVTLTKAEFAAHRNQTFIKVLWNNVVLLLDLEKTISIPENLYKYLKELKNVRKLRV